MIIVFTTILVLAVPPAQLETSATPSTRLFIRTEPSGAAVTVDGKQIGTSDGLFIVPPGVRSIAVHLDGYAPQTRQIPVREGRITRLRVELHRSGAVDSGPGAQGEPPAAPPANAVGPEPADAAGTLTAIQGAGGLEAAIAFVSQGNFPATTQRAMLTVLRQHPGETRWSGRDGTLLFGIAIRPLPQGESRSRAVPAMLELVRMLAVHEVLTAKSLLDRYAATGLTDGITLRQAVQAAAGQLQVIGRARGVVHQAAVRSGFAVAYFLADTSELSAYLLQPAELDIVRSAYRDVMHRQAREMMSRSQWADALLLWRHLHQRQLVSQQLYLDAARCFQQLDQMPDAVRVLDEAIRTFAQSGTAAFFEQAGDMALEIETEPAQTLAEQAYEKAIDLLRETVSGSEMPARTGLGQQSP